MVRDVTGSISARGKSASDALHQNTQPEKNSEVSDFLNEK